MKYYVVLLVGAVCVLMLADSPSAQICSQCQCGSQYYPVCARDSNTNRVRHFSNKCVFDCTNKCQDNKFIYVGPGRCRRYANQKKGRRGNKQNTKGRVTAVKN